MKSRTLLPFALFALILYTANGCNKHRANTATSKISGMVTLNGAPLEKGSIMFTAADKSTEPATGEIKDGKYSLNVAPGPKIVRIDASKVVGKRKKYEGEANSPEVDVTESIIPPNYNIRSELKVDISADSKELAPFELKSN